MGRSGRHVAFGLGRKRRPPVLPPAQKGFGSRLLEDLLIRDLGGHTKLDYDQPAYDAGSPRPFNSPHRVSDANFYARGTALSRIMRIACRMRPRRLTPNARHRARCDQGHDVGCCSRAYRASMTGVTHRQRRKCSVHGTEGQAVDMGRAGLELVTGAEIFQTYTFLPDAAGRLPAAFSLSIGMKKRPPFRRAFRQKVGSGRDNAIVIIDAPSSGSILPTPIVVAAVFGRTLQLLFGDAGPVAAKAGIVLEGLPR